MYIIIVSTIKHVYMYTPHNTLCCPEVTILLLFVYKLYWSFFKVFTIIFSVINNVDSSYYILKYIRNITTEF